MKHILWLAFLLPTIALANPYTNEFCETFPLDDVCVGFVLDRDRLDTIEAAAEPVIAKLTAADSVGTLFNSFIVASGPEDVKTDFTIFVRQPDGTFALIIFDSAFGGHWPTGNIRYSGSGCTGTAYYLAAWAFTGFGGHEGSIVITAQAGFNGIPYTFAIGPLFSATVASNSVSGHPITAPVCNDFSPFVQTGLRLAIPVQGLPAVVVPPSVATIQLGP